MNHEQLEQISKALVNRGYTIKPYNAPGVHLVISDSQYRAIIGLVPSDDTDSVEECFNYLKSRDTKVR